MFTNFDKKTFSENLRPYFIDDTSTAKDIKVYESTIDTIFVSPSPLLEYFNRSGLFRAYLFDFSMRADVYSWLLV